MKIDIFTHILPKRYNEKMLELDPQGKDIDKRVRAANWYHGHRRALQGDGPIR